MSHLPWIDRQRYAAGISPIGLSIPAKPYPVAGSPAGGHGAERLPTLGQPPILIACPVD